MDLSRKGAIFIACREAIVLTAYPDGEHFSIGMGHNNPKLKKGDTITVKQAFDLLRKDIAPRVAQIKKRLMVSVLQHEFDALFSAYYQSGTDALDEITAAINVKDRPGIARAYLNHDTNKAGIPIDGLLKRRARELCLHLTGEYGDLSTILLWRGLPSETKAETYELRHGDI